MPDSETFDLQAAINAAKPGDVITIPAGAIVPQCITLPRGKGCTIVGETTPITEGLVVGDDPHRITPNYFRAPQEWVIEGVRECYWCAHSCHPPYECSTSGCICGAGVGEVKHAPRQ